MIYEVAIGPVTGHHVIRTAIGPALRDFSLKRLGEGCTGKAMIRR